MRSVAKIKQPAILSDRVAIPFQRDFTTEFECFLDNQDSYNFTIVWLLAREKASGGNGLIQYRFKSYSYNTIENLLGCMLSYRSALVPLK